MNTVQSEAHENEDCLLKAGILGHFYQAQAEDILTDDDLLDLFRIVKQILRKKPDTDRVAKLLFCISYALGDTIKFCKPMHDDRILFRDLNHQLGTVVLPSGTSSCCSTYVEEDQWSSASAASPLSRIFMDSSASTTDNTSTESFRPYTHFQPPPAPSQPEDPLQKYPHLHTLLSNALRGNPGEVLMEPKQRGFYYQDGRIAREPALLQRYAEQGVLTQASLMRKRKRQLPDIHFPYELASLPAPAKKPKIPHRHGEFEQRRKFFFFLQECLGPP
ncbi:hypothetical protein BJV82DRAFT_383516 [Fennellomyces sp. T-0311]|nr:hypothetical protein BJV82DRAFT_383516 [Fennellomyces sp. T-0311]